MKINSDLSTPLNAKIQGVQDTLGGIGYTAEHWGLGSIAAWRVSDFAFHTLNFLFTYLTPERMYALDKIYNDYDNLRLAPFGSVKQVIRGIGTYANGQMVSNTPYNIVNYVDLPLSPNVSNPGKCQLKIQDNLTRGDAPGSGYGPGQLLSRVTSIQILTDRVRLNFNSQDNYWSFALYWEVTEYF
jgi:hypothetical protein